MSVRRTVHRERQKVERLAERLGFTLGRGLSVNGHHGMATHGGCGSYDLVLNVKAERVDCVACGATDLVRVGGDRAD